MSVTGNQDDKIRRQRNNAVAIGLVAMVILIFVITLVRLGGNVAKRESFPKLDPYEQQQ